MYATWVATKDKTNKPDGVVFSLFRAIKNDLVLFNFKYVLTFGYDFV